MAPTNNAKPHCLLCVGPAAGHARKNAVSALELKRQLGVSYKAAWLLKHKLLQTMLLREEPRRLDGGVEIDDAYLGGGEAGQARTRLREHNRVCGGRANQRRRANPC